MTTLKLQYNDDVRRVTIAGNFPSYEELRATVENIFDIPPGAQLSYLDDEDDLCRITRQEELDEAIRVREDKIKVICSKGGISDGFTILDGNAQAPLPDMTTLAITSPNEENETERFQAVENDVIDKNAKKQAKKDEKEAKKQAKKEAKLAGIRLMKEEKQREKCRKREAKQLEKQLEKQAKKEEKMAKRAKFNSPEALEERKAAKKAEKEAKLARKCAMADSAHLEKAVRKLEKLTTKVQKLNIRMDHVNTVLTRDFPHRKLLKAARKATVACDKAQAKAQKCNQSIQALKKNAAGKDAPDVPLAAPLEGAATAASSSESEYLTISSSECEVEGGAQI